MIWMIHDKVVFGLFALCSELDQQSFKTWGSSISEFIFSCVSGVQQCKRDLHDEANAFLAMIPLIRAVIDLNKSLIHSQTNVMIDASTP